MIDLGIDIASHEQPHSFLIITSDTRYPMGSQSDDCKWPVYGNHSHEFVQVCMDVKHQQKFRMSINSGDVDNVKSPDLLQLTFLYIIAGWIV